MSRRALFGALGFGAALALPPVAYTLFAAGLADDPLLRAWLGGALVPGRTLADPWRLATAPLLHVDGAHLAVNGAFLVILGAAAALRMGPLRAGALAAASAVVGGLASVGAALGWAAGASGAVFGLLGGLAAHVARTDRRGGLLLGLLAVSLWAAVPADRVAHLGGLVAGAALGAGALSDRAARALAIALAGFWIAGLALAGRHLARAGDPGGEWRRVDGLAVPAHWSRGVPIAPCPAAWTDGLVTVCRLDAAPSDPPVGVRIEPLPGGGFLSSHAVSPAARDHHEALLAALRARSGPAGKSPAAPPGP